MAERTAESSKFGCLMAMVPESNVNEFLELQKRISVETLADEGLETEPHVTVLYGFKEDFRSQLLIPTLGHQQPIAFTLGKLSRFENAENGYDVIKFDVISPQLVALNKDIAERFSDYITPSKYGYNPHLTVAYVKPGTNTDLDASGLEGKIFTVNSLLYSLPKKEGRKEISLFKVESVRSEMTPLKFRFSEISEPNAEGKLRVAFSSETPVLRTGDGVDHPKGQKYWEILDHSPENADIKLLNQRGAFLDEHNFKDQIGVVESAEICPDKIGRADISFCEDPKSKDRSIQLRTKKRPHISFGYIQTRCISETMGADNIPVKRFAFQAYEISSVAVPADIAVGVGRAAVDSPEKVIVEPIENKIVMPESTVDIKEIETKARTNALTDFKTRAKQITTIGDLLIKDHGEKDNGTMKDKIRSMVNDALASDEDVGKLQIRAMEEVIKAKPAKTISIRDCASPEDAKQYSLIRGIQSALKKRDEGASGIPDGLEGEVHQEFVRQAKAMPGGMGFEPTGFQVPSDVNIRCAPNRLMTRDMQATVFASGGAFVPTNLLTPIIEILRNMMVLNKAGVRTMAGLTGNVVIPRQEAAATAYSVSEIGALTASQQILGQIAMTPKRVGATQTYSKQFIMQSSPDAEAFMRDDLFQVIALLWDYYGLSGLGAASQPLGVINTPGVASVTFGATPTYIKLVSFETLIRAANVTGPITYMTTPTVKGILKTVAEALTGATTIGGSQNAIWKGDEENGRVNGYQALASNQVQGNLVIAGAFNQLIQGLWGGLDVVVDYVTKAVNAEVVLTINTWGDYVVRHPQAFVVSSDPGNQ